MQDTENDDHKRTVLHQNSFIKVFVLWPYRFLMEIKFCGSCLSMNSNLMFGNPNILQFYWDKTPHQTVSQQFPIKTGWGTALLIKTPTYVCGEEWGEGGCIAVKIFRMEILFKTNVKIIQMLNKGRNNVCSFLSSHKAVKIKLNS